MVHSLTQAPERGECNSRVSRERAMSFSQLEAGGTRFGAIGVNGVSLWIGGTESTTSDRGLLKLMVEFAGLPGPVKNAGWQPALLGFRFPLF
jgi:hypothetical protein